MRASVIALTCIVGLAGVGWPAAADEHAPATIEEVFPDYRPKETLDTLFDYRPLLAFELSALPPPSLGTLADLLAAYLDASRRARADPGAWEAGALALGADLEEYVPSDAELVVAHIADLIAEIAAAAEPAALAGALAATGITAVELGYSRFHFRHADVMGSGRYFYASPPEPATLALPPPLD